MSLSIVATAIAALILGQQAAPAAQCAAPTLPAVQRPVLPAPVPRPDCIDDAGQSSCRPRETEAYNTQVAEYNTAAQAWQAEVRAYNALLLAYVEEARVYAECENQAVVPPNMRASSPQPTPETPPAQ